MKIVSSPMKMFKEPQSSKGPTGSNRKFNSVGPKPRTNSGGIPEVLIDNSPLNNKSKKRS